MTAPAPSISNELKTVLRAVKLGRCLDTLPERLALAGSRGLGHAQFLELVLSDEITRRETTSAALRARSAGLDPDMAFRTGTRPPRSASITPSGTSCARCGSSKPATTR